MTDDLDVARSQQVYDRCSAGESAAFAELFEENRPRLHSYLRSRLPDWTTADDLVQETFIRAWRRLDDFEWQGRPFHSWLTTIARNLVADHFKSSRVRNEMLVDVRHGPTGERATVEPGPEEWLVSAEECAARRAVVHAVLAAMERLSEDQRECLRLRFLRDLSVAETAEAMGRSETAVKGLSHRACVNLSRMGLTLANGAER